METDYKSISNQKNESTPNPSYNWKDVTPEFFDSIKGNIILLLSCRMNISIFL